MKAIWAVHSKQPYILLWAQNWQSGCKIQNYSKVLLASAGRLARAE
ncbi:hypothetical protein [Nostoc sp.]